MNRVALRALVLMACSAIGGSVTSCAAGVPQPAVVEPPVDAPRAADEPRISATRFDIPPGHLPPAGQCRIWVPGEPPGQQKKDYPVGRCSELRALIPDDAWLIYRPTDDRSVVRVWQYGADRRVLSQRIYDAVTGELIRHVGPTGN